jgi:hypothetical protein
MEKREVWWNDTRWLVELFNEKEINIGGAGRDGVQSGHTKV